MAVTQTEAKRKYYIDNLRILCILMLFPYHSAMIFNNFGENWYVHSQDSLILTQPLVAIYPWWMTLLFVIAGMSTVYALKKQTAKAYAKERCLKLLIPFIAALVLLIPVQTYIADVYFNHYQGNYFEHLPVFFKLTDWSGYDGHFTPGHTWFILYLFVISMVTLPLLMWYKNKKEKLDGQKMTMVKILPMCLIVGFSSLILNIGGKSVGQFTACFLVGYLVMSMEEVQERLEKYCIPLGITWLALMVAGCVIYDFKVTNFWIRSVGEILLTWIGILACLGLGKRFLDRQTAFTKYFTAAAFPIYIIHQSVIVIVGYGIVHLVSNIALQYVSIVTLSFLLTLGVYEVFRRIKLTCFLFGIKEKQIQA